MSPAFGATVSRCIIPLSRRKTVVRGEIGTGEKPPALGESHGVGVASPPLRNDAQSQLKDENTKQRDEMRLPILRRSQREQQQRSSGRPLPLDRPTATIRTGTTSNLQKIHTPFYTAWALRGASSAFRVVGSWCCRCWEEGRAVNSKLRICVWIVAIGRHQPVAVQVVGTMSVVTLSLNRLTCDRRVYIHDLPWSKSPETSRSKMETESIFDGIKNHKMTFDTPNLFLPIPSLSRQRQTDMRQLTTTSEAPCQQPS